jgi:glycosyltransferase involved in cell wall biosynthesis
MPAVSSNPSCLFYVVDWLPPEFGAVGQYGVVFAREMASAGRRVVLVGLTTGSSRSEIERFGSGGTLEISRIAISTYDKTKYASRLLWLLKANFYLIASVTRDPRSRGGEILFTGAPPFILFFAVIAKYIRGARLIYRITDFYPEVIIAELGRKSVPLSIFEWLTWAMRGRLDLFQALGEDQRKLLIAGGIPPHRIVLKRDLCPVPMTGRERPMCPPPALCGHPILLYSGNYSVAHEIETVIEGLIRHRQNGNNSRLGLWLSASGKNVASIEQRLRRANVPVACTKPVALEDLPSLLAAADVHLITLRNQFSGIVLPSKVYACIASGRPILFVGPESSDVHLLCRRGRLINYERVEPGDSDGFAAAIERLALAVQTGRHRVTLDNEQSAASDSLKFGG